MGLFSATALPVRSLQRRRYNQKSQCIFAKQSGLTATRVQSPLHGVSHTPTPNLWVGMLIDTGKANRCVEATIERYANSPQVAEISFENSDPDTESVT